ncbi:MAG TPA: 4-hydroxy-tetrahydrodipicolinate reductase [Gemmataceae bacterium]|nr:4-hydroxy-tetrahydrodipicolinate reductase [Gemmataceae bacterium]
MKISLGVNGACGRMGLRVIDVAHADKDVNLAAALETPAHPLLGRDAGELAGVGTLGLKVIGELPLNTRLDVLIDFSTPEGTMAVLPVCVARRIPILIATTGHTPQDRVKIAEAAHETAVLHAPNTSLAVNVLMRLVRDAARMLRDRDFDMEIVERHHRFKKDAPSGTALALAKILQGEGGAMELRHGREGIPGERTRQEIGIHAVRVGDNVGEHNVIFSTLGETLELSHKAHARDCYARGAIQAAKFLAGRPAGVYTMEDVLGLSGEA